MLQPILRLFRAVPSEHRSVMAAIRSMTGLRPNDPGIYLAAFRRKVKTDANQRSANMRYERLEYLGDAVLGVLMAEYLYEKYPNGDEGYLTSMRSKVVSRKALNRIAEKMGIPQWMDMGRGRSGRQGQTSSVPGNTLEALVGAVYIDRG
jgi:ribonuclease-3